MRETRETRETRRARREARAARLAAALSAAVEYRWPVVPGAPAPGGHCTCDSAECPVPGAHPHDPPLLAATTDPRMVQWWWERQNPDAPVLVATGRAVSAVSLPAEAGARALAYFEALRMPLGPVLAMPGRYALLVAPYSLDALAELLSQQDWVPGSLRYHGPGGYLALPPGCAQGRVRWVLAPKAAPGGGVWLPEVGPLLEELVTATATQDSGHPRF
ncbi:bifunctional DNA primase/polymerase [Kitasatospora sp. NPDC050543]|uniref:bifunctional DNA primase/polymerase n=1 Tax=Kitasatospora sp. NPDC050543 TaxID=3364054 RepID=UPI0037892D76